jgi:NTP pyrophosphatase (non-canonical NTP hydrolase)
MELKKAQQLMLRLYGERDRKRGVEGTFMWLFEEIGELSEAVRKKDVFNMKAEFADVLAWLLSLANVLDVNITESFEKKYDSKCPSCKKAPCICSK